MFWHHTVGSVSFGVRLEGLFCDEKQLRFFGDFAPKKWPCGQLAVTGCGVQEVTVTLRKHAGPTERSLP
jgi:hypothetical protein